MTRTVRVGLGVVICAVVLLFGVVITLPRHMHVERSIEVAKAPEIVFEHVVDYRKNEAWSPWKAQDDTMVFTWGAKTRGVGATYSWTSANSGNGSMALREADPPKRIVNDIVFEGMGNAVGTWTFEPRGEGTVVRWQVDADQEGVFAGLFVAMADKMVGPSFELGLQKLKEVAEATPDPEPEPIGAGIGATAEGE